MNSSEGGRNRPWCDVAVRDTYNSAVRKTRAMLFAHTLADLAGVPHNGHALGVWWVKTHGLQHDDPYSSKWIAYFEGSLPRDALLQQMLGEFPVLRQVLCDPLWLALSGLSADRSFWDRCAAALRMDGKPLPDFTNLAMARLCSSPSWTKIGPLLILMRSEARSLVGQRAWLKKNFSLYFYLACLRSPLWHIRYQLLDLISALLDCELLVDGELRAWERKYKNLNHTLNVYQDILECMFEYEWVHAWNDQAFLLLWEALEDIELVNALLNSKTRMVMPDRLRMQWSRAKKTILTARVSLPWTAIGLSRDVAKGDLRIMRRVGVKA